MSLHYEISIKSPHKHLFSVKLTLKEPNPLGQAFKLPNWIPGSYLIRDFSKHIVSIHAESGGKDVPLRKTDKNNWIAHPCTHSISIEYDVYAFDLSVRSAYLTNERAFFNGTSVFLLPLGFEDEECELIINLPSNKEVLGQWQCATTMKPQKKSHSTEIYEADNYNELIDHPVEISNFTLFEFEANKIQHRMALTGTHSTDIGRLSSDLTSICQHHMDFFGGATPFDNYLFLTLVRSHGYGGLEHKKSTSLICSRSDLPVKGMTSIGPDYTKFLALCSHEYFHAWWIKAIKPANFINLDYDRENYTEQLWIFEGFTSYYDELSLLRTNILTPDQYLSLFSKNVTKVQKSSGRMKQSIAESSFDAWTKFYQQDENAPNSIVSYYSKGALLAFVLDIDIRRNTDGDVSLDDIIKYIWENYKFDGLEDDTVKLVIEELTMLDYSDFFNSYVYGVKELPLSDSFHYVGVECTFKHSGLSSFGISTKESNGSSIVTHVFDSTSSQLGGLYVGDIIVTIDKLKVDFKDLEDCVGSKSVGDTIAVGFLRDDTLGEMIIKIIETDKTFCELSIQDKLDPETKNRQRRWFYR